MRKDTERKLQKVKKRISKSAGTNDKLIQKRKRQNGERKPQRLLDKQRQIWVEKKAEDWKTDKELYEPSMQWVKRDSGR